MNILKCKNGHFFDADEYEVCPMCGAETAQVGDIVNPEPQNLEKKSKGGWLNGKKSLFGGKVKNETDEHKKEKPIIHKKEKNGLDKKEPIIKADASEDKKTEGWSKPKPEIVEVDIAPINEENSLKDVVKKASANEDGKTTGYFMSRYESSSDSSMMQSEPVVGWLVCIKGNHIGESFEVFSGKNTIGRNSDNRIVLSKDSGISREKHAYIIFDPKNTEYYLQPGDGNGLTYVNGSFVPSTQKINNKDIITLSNCELLLVSLCNEEFSWDRYIKE